MRICFFFFSEAVPVSSSSAPESSSPSFPTFRLLVSIIILCCECCSLRSPLPPIPLVLMFLRSRVKTEEDSLLLSLRTAEPLGFFFVCWLMFVGVRKALSCYTIVLVSSTIGVGCFSTMVVSSSVIVSSGFFFMAWLMGADWLL